MQVLILELSTSTPRYRLQSHQQSQTETKNSAGETQTYNTGESGACSRRVRQRHLFQLRFGQ